MRDVLSEEECQQFIEISERMGYEEAKVSTFRGMVSMPDVRNNYRVIWEVREEILQKIWERIKDFIPRETQLSSRNWHPVGLNERFRFYRCKFLSISSLMKRQRRPILCSAL